MQDKRNGIAITAFTESGRELARKVAHALGEERCALRQEQTPLKQWTEENFGKREALIFIGAAGVSLQYGLSCVEPFEVEVRKALISISDSVILLADSSKLGKSWLDHYASIDEIDMLITDSGITEEQEEKMTQTGIRLCVV